MGVGLLTALAGASEIDLVVQSTRVNGGLLKMGEITPSVMITIAGVVIICVLLFYRIKGAFCVSLMFGSIVYWWYSNSWPPAIVSSPYSDLIGDVGDNLKTPGVPLLIADLVFLFVLFLNGLIISLSDLADLTRTEDSELFKAGSVPRGRWLYFFCGVMTVCGGCMTGPPILISPESTAAIKAG